MAKNRSVFNRFEVGLAFWLRYCDHRQHQCCYVSLTFVEIEECVSSPCHNGATCTDFIDFYNCTCQAGYDGPHCENGKTCALFYSIGAYIGTCYLII